MRLLTAAAVGLALSFALGGCGKDAETATAPTESATPIARIAPPAGTSWAETVTVTPEGGYLMGNPDAPIKLVEFGALSCSHCADFSAKAAAPLRDDYVSSGRVSFELRLFMLNPYDVPAAMLVTCGAPEAVIPLSEQFWAWQPNMFTNLQNAGEARLQAIGNLPPEKRYAPLAEAAGMTEFFAARGISADQAAACLNNSARATELANQTQAAAEKYNVQGTPTFRLNGADIGTLGWEQLEPMLQKAGAR